MAKKKESTKDEPGFSAALDELEAILQRIEGEEIDIDDLAAELRRTAQLLELCRGKLRKAEVEVTQIVQSLDQEPEAAEEEWEPGEGDAEDEEDEDDEGIPF